MLRSSFAFACLMTACSTGLDLSDSTHDPSTNPSAITSTTCTAMHGGVSMAGSPMTGGFSGPELAGVFCTNGAYAIVEQTPESISAGSSLDMFIGTTGVSTCSVQTPSGGYDCQLQALLTVPAAQPGTYKSSDASPCSILLFSAIGPSSPANCDNVKAPAVCPTGCVYGGGSSLDPAPCVPAPGPEVQYAAQAGGGVCLDTESYAKLGSWTLTLTSVTQNSGGSASEGTYYDAHGSLTATMISGHDLSSGAVDSSYGDNTEATLSLTF